MTTDKPEILWSVIGAAVRLCGKTVVGRAGLEAVGKITGAAIAGAGLFGVKKASSPPDVAAEWFKVLDAVGCSYEVGQSDDDQVEVFVLECPAGLTEKDGEKTCSAGMSADRELVKRLGGALVIGETIATGADRCNLKVVRADDAQA